MWLNGDHDPVHKSVRPSYEGKSNLKSEKARIKVNGAVFAWFRHHFSQDSLQGKTPVDRLLELEPRLRAAPVVEPLSPWPAAFKHLKDRYKDLYARARHFENGDHVPPALHPLSDDADAAAAAGTDEADEEREQERDFADEEDEDDDAAGAAAAAAPVEGQAGAAERATKELRTKREMEFVSSSVVNSPAYWKETVRDLYAMCRECRAPTLFVTFTLDEKGMVDMRRHTTQIFPADGSAPNLAVQHYQQPVLSAEQFHRRVEIFLQDHVYGGLQLLGKVRHAFRKVEEQNRKSLHLHVVFWIDEDDADSFYRWPDKNDVTHGCKCPDLSQCACFRRPKIDIRATMPDDHGANTTACGRILREMLPKMTHACTVERDGETKDRSCRFKCKTPEERCTPIAALCLSLTLFLSLVVAAAPPRCAPPRSPPSRRVSSDRQVRLHVPFAQLGRHRYIQRALGIPTPPGGRG